MFTSTARSRSGLLTCIVTAMTGSPLLADDTEVYIGDLAFSTSIRPNVLFVIDTSSSMATDVLLTTGIYDPATTYPGSCEAGYLYWATPSANGVAPDCTTDNYVELASNNCADSHAALATGAAGGPGYYTGTLARYNVRAAHEDRWEGLSSADHSEIIDCQADYGVHGNGGGGTYPADQNDGGPYTGSAASAINWNSTGGVYTLYSANYLNWINSPGTAVTRTRMQIVQDVLGNLVDSTSGINAALMRFDGRDTVSNQGGYFLLPMQILDSGSRPAFKSAVNSLSADGYTPLAETLYEATRYYRGEAVRFGASTSPDTNHTGVLDPADSNRYASPIDYQCQQNYIVLLTDGDPSFDSDADSDIAALPDFATTAGSCDFNSGDDCLDELAQYLFDYDQRTDLDDDQHVTTYTIGFATSQQLLQDAANRGGGKYYTADDTVQLTTVFTRILSDILALDSTFVTPVAPVNAFNRLTHRDELYFALFRPGKFPQWPGNLKRYRLTNTGIVDAAGNAAIDTATGFFAAGATSFWTSGADAPDGDDIGKGGAAAELGLARNMYTYTGSGAPSNVDLTLPAHAFSEANALITKAMLGNAGMTDARRTALLQWARGVDLFDSDEDGSTTDARRRMGDPLHGNPVAVNYGGSDASPDVTLYLATNEGVLHAIDSTDGSEQFSFIPQELLPNQDILFSNSGASSHPYGLDGPLTVWAHDANNNGVLQDGSGNTEAGEHAYLYVGMRRGGSNYYALDVTDRGSPELKWMIQGGQGDFGQLAQTWSKMELARIRRNGNPHTALIFGGGYDINQDSESAGSDSEGNAVYLVDADSGVLLWSAGNTGSGADLTSADMIYSIPAPLMAGDINADGYTDIAFAVDMGGQVWRFDFNNSGSDTTVTGGVVARLAGSGTGAHRRLYVKPDVSLIDVNGDTRYAVAIGSGYRAHPLSTVTQDRFHMLFIGNVGTAPASYGAPLDDTDLADITGDLSPNLSSASGWRLDLEPGEKVLAKSLTVDGTVYFTTYKPDTSATNSCAPSRGVGRLYAVNAYDATPVDNLDGVGTLSSLTTADRYLTLVRGGIQPEPQVIFLDSGRPLMIVGPQAIDSFNLLNPVRRTSWTD